MVKACVLIKAVPTKIDLVLRALREMPEVKKAYPVFGRFDIASFLEVEDSRRLSEITARINSMEGVRSTETLMEA